MLNLKDFEDVYALRCVGMVHPKEDVTGFDELGVVNQKVES